MYAQVRWLTESFRGQDLFSFAGPNRFEDGKLFLERFQGVVETSGVKHFKTALEDTAVYESHSAPQPRSRIPQAAC